MFGLSTLIFSFRSTFGSLMLNGAVPAYSISLLGVGQMFKMSLGRYILTTC